MSLRTVVKQLVLLAGSVIHRNRGSKILYYHDVFATTNYRAFDADIRMGTPLELFKRHIDVIRSEGFEIVPRITDKEGQVAIMFDDGFRGIWECRNYFYENNICPTIFIPAGYIGRTDLGLLSVDEILALQSQGFIFECHGWSHVPLTRFSNEELRHELGDSRRRLSDILSRDVRGICMPLGFFSEHLIDQIRGYGYENIYSCIPGNYSYHPFGLLTRNLCQYASPREVRLILRGGNELLKNRYVKLHLNAI